MKKLVVLLFLTLSLIQAQDYYKNRVLFCLDKSVSPLTIDTNGGLLQTNLPELNILLQQYGAIRLQKWLKSADASDVVGEIDLSKVYRVHFSRSFSNEELQMILSDFENVVGIHSADFESINRADEQYSSYTPNDPMYNDQWWLKKIQADYAWGLWSPGTPGSTSVLVGVVDTGVDYLHPDLATTLYINPAEDINHDGQHTAADNNNVDEDGNGYKDDVRGWDFAGANSSGTDDNDIRPPNAGPDKELSHGTHVTGIIAAASDNSTGISSVSYRAKVVATKNAADDDLTQPGIIQGYDGILYCAKLGAKIINCSWGGGYMSSYERSILDDVSDNYGAIVVGASGNDNQDNDVYKHYPSDYSKCISVASTDNTDLKAYYSNYGSVIDISAPGGEGSASSTAILSTIHDNAGSYEAWQGTSMASPVVAGSLALLKAWFPSQSRQWYIDEIQASADSIDHLNSGYEGQLGSGRVNVYVAISNNIYPKLTIQSYTTSIINDNGDGQLNPGEQGKIVLTIKNDPVWSQAQNVTAVLSVLSSYITFPDSNANFGTVNAGATASNSTDDLIFQLSADAPLEPLTIDVTIRANQSGSYPYETMGTVQVSPSMNQAGFPVTHSPVDVPAVVADILPGSSGLEIVCVGDDDKVYMYLANGSVASGFPVAMGAFTAMGPVVADVDNDGQQEIVIANKTSSSVKIIESNGTIALNKAMSENIYGSISVANMDADAQLEIVFGTMSKKIHVLNPDGTEIPNFPYTAAALIEKGVALADVNGDGVPEMIFGMSNTDIVVLKNDATIMPNFPVDLSTKVSVTPVVADLNGVYHIIAATTDKKVWRITMDGVKQFSTTLNGAIKSAPALGDFDNNGALDIAIGTDTKRLYVLTFNGDSLAQFPKILDGIINTSPIFADLNNDNVLELISSTGAGRVHAYQPDGSIYPNFPALLASALNGSPCAADIDGDNDFEIIVGGGNGLNVIDAKGPKGVTANVWMTYLADNACTGKIFFNPGGSALEDEVNTPNGFALDQNYPNPFNPQTTIEYGLAVNSKVELSIYNLLGQKVATLVAGDQTAGQYVKRWDGRNNLGQILGSGVYVYKLHVKNAQGQVFHQSRKMLMLR